MVDITKLKLGDTFYRVYGYAFMYKMEVVQEYDPERDILAAKYLEGRITHLGERDWISPDEDEKYFNTYEEAEKAFKDAEQERLDYLSDINHLLDELYAEIKDSSNHTRLYGEAIKQFKAEMRK